MIEMDYTATWQVLEAKQRELKASRSAREDILIERTADEWERMQQTASREVAIRHIDHECNLLKEVVAAIERLSQGIYGTCSSCEEAISAKRLRAVPWATRCVTCQELVDSTRPEHHGSMAYLREAG